MNVLGKGWRTTCSPEVRDSKCKHGRKDGPFEAKRRKAEGNVGWWLGIRMKEKVMSSTAKKREKWNRAFKGLRWMKRTGSEGKVNGIFHTSRARKTLL